jgi:signal transduction histidine kinase/CheY-like chemotaxis protein
MMHWKAPKLQRSVLIGYGTVPLLVLAAILLRLYVVKQSPNSPFLIVLVITAWYWGFGPGLLTTILCSAASGWFLSSPHSVRALLEIALGQSFFLAVSLGIRKIYEGHKSTRAAVLALKDGLDDRDRKLVVSEENLRDETRKLKAVLNSIGEGVIVADPSGEFLVFNPAARQILGRDQSDRPVEEWSEYYGIFLPDMVTPYPALELPLARALRGEAADDVELFIQHDKKPAGVWLSVTARPLRDGRGDSRGAVAIFRDISANKRVEEAQMQAKEAAEHANRAKSEFLSRMSHELRTPLNSILGFAQILELSDLSTAQCESVEYILKGGRHLLGLINEVLDIARIEAGRLSISPEPVRVSDALQHALELVGPLAARHNVKLAPGRAMDCQRYVLADRQRLAQVLLNLLSNAVKYNHAGGAVSLSCQDGSNGRFRIKVTDTGPGISPLGLQKLFAPFERLDAEQTGVEGTGLGLALSKRLIEAMGGAIGVESSVGQGSTFWVDLSSLEDPLENIQRTSDAGLQALRAGTSEGAGTVIYIEDNLSNLRLMEHIVSNRPEVKLIAAMQGQLGLELIQEHQPDLILLDLHLPDIHGDEVLRRLRQDPRTRSIPVVMVSADATPGQIERLLEAGASDYLTKPLDVRKLLELLDRTLKPRLDHAGPRKETLGTLIHAERDRSE